MQILQYFIFFVSVLLGIYGLYFGIMALQGLRKSKSSFPVQPPKKRIACVIAARNEQAVIGPLIDSLFHQDYPRELFEVIVAPNNCTDQTKEVAQEHGARIFEPQGTIKSKGEVLTQIVDQIILKENFDGMCIFDADNLVTSGFLALMNNALCAGAHVVQGFRDSKNPKETTMSGCYSICYWMINRFYNIPRAHMHLSALLNGSGFVVSQEMLAKLGGWHTVTMTEDYEFTAQCAMAGERVHFINEAVIYDEQPLTFLQSWHQRRRWTTGALQGFQVQALPLLKSAIQNKNLVCLDLFLTFIMPVIQLISIILALLSFLPVLTGKSIVIGNLALYGFLPMLGFSASFTFIGLFFTILIALITVLLKNQTAAGMWKAISCFWIFSFSQTILTILSFFRKEKTWKPIAHTSIKQISEMEQAAKVR